ncbi:MAG: acetate--CoA ligase family protein [Betaproteobacteria bacterium]|nr:acetate--CoA ligase family protein [Betaproteobacteria bacterium]
MSSLERLFSPRGIAIVGAQADPSRGGGQPLRALLSYGYAGRVYPVNPRHSKMAGLKCYASLSDIDGPCDVAVIAIPAAGVIDAVKECGASGIPHAVVYSAAFGESGEQGTSREKELADAARNSGVRLIGPNCLGVVNITDHVYAAFGSMTRAPRLRSGPVSMVSQSGGFGYSIVLRCAASGAGFRYLVSSGNEIDVTTPELIDAYLDDPDTKVVVSYIEGVVDGRALMDAGRKAAQVGKAILMWKAGNSEQGRRAAASHTGSMTGSYDIYQAAMRQAGIIEVRSFEEVAELVKVFSTGRLPRGRNVALMSASGGAAAVFADTAEQVGLSLPPATPRTVARLKTAGLLGAGSASNPIDCAPGFLNDDIACKFAVAADAMLGDPNIDQLCMMLMTVLGKQALNGARALVSAVQRRNKPILVFSSVPRDTAEEACRLLEEAGIPILSSPANVACAAAATAAYVETRERLARPAPNAKRQSTPPELPAAPGALSEVDSKRLLARYGVPVTRDVLVPPGEDAKCSGLRPPFAVKVVSPDIAHKTEAGCVRLNVAGGAALRIALNDVLAGAQCAAPDARIDGVLVSEMITDGVEALVGVVNDPAFGPVVAFGLGGVFTEVLHDLSYRVVPFDRETAHAMIGELRAKAIFRGVRGKPALDTQALADALVAVSQLAWDLRDRIQELDINPLLVRPHGKGVAAADALVVLR